LVRAIKIEEEKWTELGPGHKVDESSMRKERMLMEQRSE
jgi:hypothetical protein